MTYAGDLYPPVGISSIRNFSENGAGFHRDNRSFPSLAGKGWGVRVVEGVSPAERPISG